MLKRSEDKARRVDKARREFLQQKEKKIEAERANKAKENASALRWEGEGSEVDMYLRSWWGACVEGGEL